jgi:DNA ligase D-like protein (predicted ligase)
MLATLVDTPFSDDRWVFERKLDGVRVLVARDGDRVSLRSRSGHELRETYPEVAEAWAAQPWDRFVVDGEVVAFEGNRTSFARLQGRMQRRDARAARRTGIEVFHYTFDLLVLGDDDLRDQPLRERKSRLRSAFEWADPLRYTPHRNADGEALLADACARGWEGLIAKRADARYRPGRSRDWLKLKCVAEQEVVIGGWTAPQGARTGLGALLVGVHDTSGLRYVGRVGTGFSEAVLRDLTVRLEARERPTSPFATGDPPTRGVRWCDPDLVAQVGFTEWTTGGKLRHPRFVGLRHDKPAAEVTREVPA